ncbi:MAG TPA: hypothetical protein VM509_14445, partial [Planctomycetota bacterium]|nr:hypothetical protein [Planctomycetota bacterium]
EDRLEGRIAAGEAKPAEPAATDPAKPETAPAGPAKPDDGFTVVNAPALIVNEEVVSMLDIRRIAQRNMREKKRPNADPQQLFNEAINDGARQLLEIQGGKDMGFEPELVAKYVDTLLQREVEQYGSVTKLAEELKREDKDSFARRDEVFARVNSQLWQESISGRGRGPGGRAWRDAYVRPGRALFEQREAARNQVANRTVKLTQLVVDFGNPPGPDGKARAERLIKDYRERIENGEDMGELAELYGGADKGSRGLTPDFRVSGLAANYPELAAFLEHAGPGELSPVLPFTRNGELFGYMLIRPEEFKVAPVEPFDDPRHQEGWMESSRSRVARQREQIGLMELLQAAYVWPTQDFDRDDENP